MTEKILNADYTAGSSGLEDELLQNIAQLLITDRGSFYPSKDFGSQLRKCTIPQSAYAVSFAEQALCGIDGVSIKNVKVQGNNYKFTLLINNKERQVVASV